MKLLIYILTILTFCVSCSINTISKTDDLIISEGQGISPIILGQSTKDTIIKFFGDQYQYISHQSYSNEIKYSTLGLSFYYLIDDDSNKIFAISCDTNFKGITHKGFNIQTMVVKDMISLYGEPWWRYIGGMPEAHYDSLGIYFSVKSRENPPFEISNYSLADTTDINNVKMYYNSLYYNDSVVEITIGKPNSSF